MTNSDLSIHFIAIPLFNDNYIWVIYNSSSRKAIAVDPGAAEPLLHFLQQEQLTLTGILITHHHLDHVGGIEDIQKQIPAPIPVYGPRYETIKGINHPLEDGDNLIIKDLDLDFRIIHTPGHTGGHICYFTQTPAPWLFCGDTLFSAGCGRLFEGTPEQMYNSLQKLAQLPEPTLVFCTHEYTMANLKFAQQVEPDNNKISKHINKVLQLRADNQPSLPSSIALEKEINPFMRCDEAILASQAQTYAGKPVKPGSETFAVLRAWKDVS